MIICRQSITLRNGRVLHAHEVGKTAFCWETTPEKEKEYFERKAKEKANKPKKEKTPQKEKAPKKENLPKKK